MLFPSLIGSLRTNNTLRREGQIYEFPSLIGSLRTAHRAEKEIYSLVADIRGCTIKEAQDVDLVEFVQELVADEGVRDFLGSAVASQAQE